MYVTDGKEHEGKGQSCRYLKTLSAYVFVSIFLFFFNKLIRNLYHVMLLYLKELVSGNHLRLEKLVCI